MKCLYDFYHTFNTINIKFNLKTTEKENGALWENSETDDTNKSITSAYSKCKNETFYTHNKFSIKRAKVSLQSTKVEERKTLAPSRNQGSSRVDSEPSFTVSQVQSSKKNQRDTCSTLSSAGRHTPLKSSRNVWVYIY